MDGSLQKHLNAIVVANPSTSNISVREVVVPIYYYDNTLVSFRSIKTSYVGYSSLSLSLSLSLYIYIYINVHPLLPLRKLTIIVWLSYRHCFLSKIICLCFSNYEKLYTLRYDITSFRLPTEEMPCCHVMQTHIYIYVYIYIRIYN